jgi:hypothetical protein
MKRENHSQKLCRRDGLILGEKEILMLSSTVGGM